MVYRPGRPGFANPAQCKGVGITELFEDRIVLATGKETERERTGAQRRRHTGCGK